MDFQSNNSKQEQQNRRILEQLNEEKRRLKAVTQNQVPMTTTNNQQNPTSVLLPGDAGSNASGKLAVPASQALKQANEVSFGYYITQESNFGNVILPVLPRFVKN